MGILDTVLSILQAIAAYFKYLYDPTQIARRDEINKQLAEENGYDSVNTYLAGKDTISLSNFISEFLRRMRLTQSDSTSGRAADLLLGVLPKRSAEDRDKDLNEGLSG